MLFSVMILLFTKKITSLLGRLLYVRIQIHRLLCIFFFMKIYLLIYRKNAVLPHNNRKFKDLLKQFNSNRRVKLHSSLIPSAYLTHKSSLYFKKQKYAIHMYVVKFFPRIFKMKPLYIHYWISSNKLARHKMRYLNDMIT